MQNKGLSDMSNKLEEHTNEFENLDIKKDVFKTPRNYFDDFENDLMVKISEEKLPNENGLQLPQDYFDNFEDQILSQVQKKQQTKLVVMKLVRTITTIAAMFVIYFGVYNLLNDDKLTFDSVSESEINDWIVAKNIEIDEKTMAELIVIDNKKVELEISNFTENDLIEYLDIEDPELLYFEE